MATTYLQLMKDVGSELGDFISLVATGTGSTTTLVSVDDMIFPDGSLNGREIYFAEGQDDNLGYRRVISDTDATASTITWNAAVSVATASGDTVYCFNPRGTSVTVREIRDKINQIIRRVSLELATEVADSPQTISTTVPVLAIPAAWDYVLGLQIEYDASLPDVWESIPDALDVQRWDRTATIKPLKRGLCCQSNRRVRLIGAIGQQELAEDSDTTTVPAAWIAKVAAYELLEAAAVRTGDVATALTYGELLKTDAAKLGIYVGKRFSSVGRRVYVGAGA